MLFCGLKLLFEFELWPLVLINYPTLFVFFIYLKLLEELKKPYFFETLDNFGRN